MSMKDHFNQATRDVHGFYHCDKDTLRVNGFRNSKHYYNFLLRIMTTEFKENITTTPFSELDAEVLNHLRDELIELGGTPPELPKETENPFEKKSTVMISRNKGSK